MRTRKERAGRKRDPDCEGATPRTKLLTPAEIATLRAQLWLTPAQAGRLMQVPAKTVVYLCRQGRLGGAEKLGRGWRIPIAAVDRPAVKGADHGVPVPAVVNEPPLPVSQHQAGSDVLRLSQQRRERERPSFQHQLAEGAKILEKLDGRPREVVNGRIRPRRKPEAAN